jgi:uncharacterized protein YndB with AHSA1/START domain
MINMEKQQLKKQITETFLALHSAIEQFRQETFNIVPFENSWSAGEVVEHIRLSATGFADMLFDKVEPTDRPTDKWLSEIKSIFLNFERRMKSPDFILPNIGNYSKDSFSNQLKAIEEKLTKAVDELDLSQLCISFDVPYFGNFTRLEAIYFALYNTQRHAHQLNQIALVTNFEQENVITSTRIFNVPQYALYHAWANPNQIINWWGPHGFTNTFHQHELKPGGKWSFIMHGPDGKDYPNECLFIKVEEPVLLSWYHLSKPEFQVVANFYQIDENQSRVVFKMIFNDEETVNNLRAFITEKNEENFDKLEKVLLTPH